MPTLKRLTGWTLAAALGAMLTASPAFAKKKDPCRSSCVANNTTAESCMRTCPPPEGSTGPAYKACAEKCNKQAEEAFKKCVSDCGKSKSR